MGLNRHFQLFAMKVVVGIAMGILLSPIFLHGSWDMKGGDAYAGDLGAPTITAPSFQSQKSWTLSITDDGQLEINGKPIEKMTDPEIKATMREFSDYIKQQSKDRSLIEYYDQQTGYLLEELEKCRKGK